MVRREAIPLLLAINGGALRIRFSLYESGRDLPLRLAGKIDRIGIAGTTMTAKEADKETSPPLHQNGAGHRTAAGLLLDWLEARPDFAAVPAVGHRVVHGMTHTEPARVKAKLHQITSYDPEHLPREIQLIETNRARHRLLRYRFPPLDAPGGKAAGDSG